MRTSVRLAIITLAQKITDLARLDQDQLVEFDEYLSFFPAKFIRKIFEVIPYVYGSVGFLKKDDIIYFEYIRNITGPRLRVGQILEVDNENDSILLWDFTVNGIRRFDGFFMNEIGCLLEIDNE
jgi:hypothetical protein